MAKREREESADEDASRKRIKTSVVDRLSKLSDELILRVLSYLSVPQLAVCQRLSRKYNVLAGDNQLWKQQFYDRFVRPRANRIPVLRDEQGRASGATHDSVSKISKWLGEEHLTKLGTSTTWKKQYKLRQNWTKGSATVREIPVSEQGSVPPVLVQMQNGVIYMVDIKGLRAWSAKNDRKMVAERPFEGDLTSSPPTALSVDSEVANGVSRMIVGFENGALGIYDLDRNEAAFRHRYSHPPSSNGVISATAISWPYAVAMTATQSLSLYRFPTPCLKSEGANVLGAPRLLHSLKSRTVWPPLSTSLRVAASGITVTVAYAQPTYLSGWTVGLQEVKVSPAGEFLSSRLASAIDQHYRPLAFSVPPFMHHFAPAAMGGLATSTATELRHIHSKPTSLSYTHPYLLVSHPDNTLTLYLVNSTDEALTISSGSRLWGHTSSVSGAHVGGRGKAVSISKRGDELRVWELEGGFASTAAKRRLAMGSLSVRIKTGAEQQSAKSQLNNDKSLIQPTVSRRLSNSCAFESRLEDASELTLTRGWVGFDEENVVLLKEQIHGSQALVVYDFT